MPKNEIEKIKADILKSGLPCEIDISMKLRSAGWDAINQHEYVDEDTGKSRSIDLHAWRVLQGVPQTILVIECCKSEKPWVFYGSWKRWMWPSVFPNVLPPPEDGFKIPDFEIFKLSECSHQKKKGIFEGSISYEPFKKGKGNEIFDASMKVIKALRYDRSRLWKFDKERMEENRPSVNRIFYPVIAFDGHLYSLYFRKGKPYPKKREYLRFLVNVKERSYLIDVVTRLGFSDYLMLLEEEFLCLRQYPQKNRKS